MTQFVLKYAIIIGTILSTTLAAPWVVLDSRNDMLAMSSEISDTAVAVPLPETTLGSIDDDVVPTSEPESIPEISNDSPAPTTEEQPQADPTPEPEAEPELSPAESEVVPEVVPTTTSPLADDVQEGTPEVTTSLPILSSSVSSLLEDEVQNEDIHLRVIPDTPLVSSRQNPNSIEEDEQVASVIVVSKKKHEIFMGKKSKFSM